MAASPGASDSWTAHLQSIPAALPRCWAQNIYSEWNITALEKTEEVARLLIKQKMLWAYKQVHMESVLF